MPLVNRRKKVKAARGSPKKGRGRAASASRTVGKTTKKRSAAAKRTPKLTRATKQARKAKTVARPVVRFEVRELDPLRKCGLGTSVQLLYRLIERLDGRPPASHLVFFDRHGWYCGEHGPQCPSVAQARRVKPRLSRAS